MALVTFEGYDGQEITINSDTVVSLSSYEHFDHDKELPEELMVTNPSGWQEVSNDPDKLAKANRLRTSKRTIIVFNSGSAIVKGTVAEVRAKLKGK